MAGRDRARAAFALKKIESLEGCVSKVRAKYSTQLLKLPARLHANGLGQTVAFYLSAGSEGGEDKPEVTICTWLGEWLLRDRQAEERTGRGLMKHIVSSDECTSERYRLISAEARAVAVWLKRFAEAFLGGTTEETP